MKGDRVVFDTAQSLFPVLRGNQFHKTSGFKEIAYTYGDTEKSFRKTTRLINRIRYQLKGGTPHRTLQENTLKEGKELINHITEKSNRILKQNGFSKDGVYLGEKTEEYSRIQPAYIQQEDIVNVIENHFADLDQEELLNNPISYEDPSKTTNICIDDVIVKKQEESRKANIPPEDKKRKYVHNTIAHVSDNDGKKYILNGFNF